MGANIRFGHRAGGNVDTLRELGATLRLRGGRGRAGRGRSAVVVDDRAPGDRAGRRRGSRRGARPSAHASRASSSRVTTAVTSSATRPPTSPRPGWSRSQPTASTPVRSSGSTSRRRHGWPAAISVGTNPTFDGVAAPGGVVRPRPRRPRALRRAGAGRVPDPSARPGPLRRRRRPGGADGRRRRALPGRCSPTWRRLAVAGCAESRDPARRGSAPKGCRGSWARTAPTSLRAAAQPDWCRGRWWRRRRRRARDSPRCGCSATTPTAGWSLARRLALAVVGYALFALRAGHGAALGDAATRSASSACWSRW